MHPDETNPDYRGQVAVVTGAASGIGRAITYHALREGMCVFAADVSDEGLTALKAGAPETGGILHCHRLDVSKAEAFTRFADEVFERAAGVSLLFNNAGIMTTGRSWELPLEAWRRSIDVNVLGVVNGIRAFLPRMLAQGYEGRILNTSSIGGLVSGGEFMGAYQGTKHMVSALTESLERELRAESAKIRVSLICPGAVATAIGKAGDPEHPESQDKETGVDAAELRFRSQFARLVAEGTDPAALAEEIFAGIREDRFWIIPASVDLSRVRKRCDGITSSRPD